VGMAWFGKANCKSTPAGLPRRGPRVCEDLIGIQRPRKLTVLRYKNQVNDKLFQRSTKLKCKES
jgi:hypothetical protein